MLLMSVSLFHRGRWCALSLETAEIINELYDEISSYNAVYGIACITGTDSAGKRLVLIEDIVDTDKYFRTPVLQELVSQIEITQKKILFVVICKSHILVIYSACGEGKAAQEDKLQIRLCPMVEIEVLLPK